MTSNNFRASYSVLNTWASGNWEQAVKWYFHLEKFVTPAMAKGKEWHEKGEQDIKKSNKLPDVFGSKKLNDPKTEFKSVVHLYPWLDLVGVIDCIDGPTIYEFKTGKQSSENYANGFQTGVYGVLATKTGLYVDKAEIYKYDYTNKKSEMSIVWITDKYLKDSLNWIETIAGEMHNYLETNKLYEKFGFKCISCNKTMTYKNKRCEDCYKNFIDKELRAKKDKFRYTSANEGVEVGKV